MKLKIALPILVALVMILGTTGIVLGSYVIHRNINVTIAEPITVTPDEDVPITIFKGASTQVPFTVQNGTGSSTNITVSWDGPTPGMSISCSPISFTLAPQDTQVVTATIFADSSAVNSTITIHFTTS